MSLSAAGALLIGGAGFAAGAVNAVAGGGSLISFPALLAVGYPSLHANVTNTVSVWPGYLGGVAAYRGELTDQRHRARVLAPVALVGAAVGAVILLTTPDDVFKRIVPFLVLFACGLLALQPRIQRRVASRRGDAATGIPVQLHVTTFVGGVYGAYFGAGLGVILLAVLGIFLNESLQRVNALKSLMSLLINTVALIAFALFGPVEWVAVAIVAPASLVGGYVGGRLARRLKPSTLRWTVITFGTVVGLVLLVK
jgi:hypothetical protein